MMSAFWKFLRLIGRYGPPFTDKNVRDPLLSNVSDPLEQEFLDMELARRRAENTFTVQNLNGMVRTWCREPGPGTDYWSHKASLWELLKDMKTSETSRWDCGVVAYEMCLALPGPAYPYRLQPAIKEHNLIRKVVL